MDIHIESGVTPNGEHNGFIVTTGRPDKYGNLKDQKLYARTLDGLCTYLKGEYGYLENKND